MSDEADDEVLQGGVANAGRMAVLDCLSESIARGGEFVRRRVEAGEPAFIEMWESMGGQERFDRRRRWWAQERAHFERALDRTPSRSGTADGATPDAEARHDARG